MAQMTKRLAVKGFDGLNDGLRTDRVTLTIPANFMLIATFDKHLCVASPDIRRDWKCHEGQGGSVWSLHRNRDVLKLEENNSYKIDYMPSFGL